MKTAKQLLLIGTSMLLSVPLAFSFNQKQVEKVNAEEVRIFDLEYDPSRTTKDDIYNYIGQFTFGFNFMYEGTNVEAFTDTGSGIYINNHLDSIKDVNGNSVNIGEGILINGVTFANWVNYDPSNSNGYAFKGSTGVHQFPMDEGSPYVYSPISLWFKPKRIEFRLNLDVFYMDDIEVTFKKDYFRSYSGGYTYQLEEDVTFYSTINGECKANGAPNEKITFVRQRNEVIRNFSITNVVVSSEKTASQGGKYHYYQLYTNIVRDENRFNSAVPTDHDRYLYGNILLNDKPLTYYNSYARANKMDFTDLSDASTQNPDYETGHATGSANPRYDLAVRVDLALNDVYIIAVYLSNQFIIDFNIGTPAFSLRDGSSWFTKDNEGNSIIARNCPSLFLEKIADSIDELENFVDLSLYRLEDAKSISELIYAAEANISNASVLEDIDEIVLNTKASISLFKTDKELTTAEHIDEFISLVNAIPDTMDDEQAFVNAVNAAKDSYVKLTDEEKDLLLEDDVNKLVTASNQLDALFVYNYKNLVKEQIAAEVDVNMYRQEEKAAIQNLINEAFEAVDNASTEEEIQAVFAGFIAQIPSFADAKTLAKQELDEVDLTPYRQEQKEEVLDIIARGKILIDSCRNAEEVDNSLARILALIAKVKTDEEMSIEDRLAPIKANAKEELVTYASRKGRDNYSTSNWAMIEDYVDLACFKIDSATSEEEINGILRDAKVSIDLVELKEDIPDEPQAQGNKGCGGSIVMTSVLLSTLSLLGMGLVIANKRKQK